MHNEQSPSTHKKLYRSRTDKKISGVCGGVAHYLNVDATVVRLIVVVLALVTGFFPVVLAYLVAALVIPEEPVAGSTEA